MPHVSIDGTDAHYLALGEGERVVVVHASSSSSSQWKSLAALLSPEYEVVAPDLFGFGDTASHSGTPKQAEDADVRLVLALVEHHDSAVHIVGHSYGGRLAAAASYRSSHPVASLTLIEPTMFQLLAEAREERAWGEITELANAVISKFDAGDDWEAADAFISYWVAPGALNHFPERIQSETVSGIGVVADSWRRMFDLSSQPALADYEAIRAPTLLMEGGRSTYAIGRVAELLRRTIAGCDSVTIPEAGHMAPLTHPDSVNPYVVEHIHRHSGSNAGAA